MVFNKDKFRSLVHLVCRECRDPQKLGKTKLHKILWLSDVQNYLLRGEPLTGEQYIKMQFGPCASHIDQAIEDLKALGLLHVDRVDHGEYDQIHFYAKGDPDISTFTEKELRTIREQIQLVVEDHTASSISDRSHDELWKMAVMREEIPYQAYLVKRFAPLTTDDLAWARAEIASL